MIFYLKVHISENKIGYDKDFIILSFKLFEMLIFESQ